MKIDPQFSSHWRIYILQSLHASITVFFITLVLGMEHALISYYAKPFIRDLV
jgi:hypothetical protein